MTTATKAGASLQFARELFTRGTDIFGPEEIRSVFGIEIPEAEVPPLPFSDDELRTARRLGHVLVLQVPGITMQQIHAKRENETADGRPLLYNTDWYRGESFFMQGKLPGGWRLVSKKVLPGSLGQNYLQQTVTIVSHLGKVFGTEMPPDARAAIDEFAAQEHELQVLMGKDWNMAAERLARLKVNQLFRQSPVEVLWLLTLYEMVNHERLLSNNWMWTNELSSYGYLVYVGGIGGSGVSVGYDNPRGEYGFLGVCFSRGGKCEP